MSSIKYNSWTECCCFPSHFHSEKNFGLYVLQVLLNPLLPSWTSYGPAHMTMSCFAYCLHFLTYNYVKQLDTATQWWTIITLRSSNCGICCLARWWRSDTRRRTYGGLIVLQISFTINRKLSQRVLRSILLIWVFQTFPHWLICALINWLILGRLLGHKLMRVC